MSILDDRKLSICDAQRLTGIAHSEFSRIRNAQLRRFTLDRLIMTTAKTTKTDITLAKRR